MKTKNYLFVLFFILCVMSMAAQSRATLIQLTNKNWTMKFPSPKDYTFTEFYTTEVIKAIFEYKGEKTEICYRYYLSENIESAFNESNVGKIQSGRYIILKNLINGDIFVNEILEISSTYLKLQVLSNNSILEYVVK